jgi:hypothetical protein
VADPDAYERNKGWAKIGPYETALNPNQEKQFLAWVANNRIPFDPNERPNDYDMRGYWKALQENKVQRQDPNDPEAHFPDTFKTPYHESFSNESKYATPNAPRWVGDQLITKDGMVIFDETQVRR